MAFNFGRHSKRKGIWKRNQKQNKKANRFIALTLALLNKNVYTIYKSLNKFVKFPNLQLEDINKMGRKGSVSVTN